MSKREYRIHCPASAFASGGAGLRPEQVDQWLRTLPAALEHYFSGSRTRLVVERIGHDSSEGIYISLSDSGEGSQLDATLAGCVNAASRALPGLHPYIDRIKASDL